MRPDNKEWRAIPQFSKYEVSESGDVRLAHDITCQNPLAHLPNMPAQLVRFKAGRVLTVKWRKDNGRARYALWRDDGKKINWMRARLVAMVFVPNPDNKPFVCHLDGNDTNDQATNLYWGTGKENAHDRWAHGTMCNGEKAPAALLTAPQVQNIRRQLKNGLPPSLICLQYGVKRRTIEAIRDKQNWSWLKEEGAEAPSYADIGSV